MFVTAWFCVNGPSQYKKKHMDTSATTMIFRSVIVIVVMKLHISTHDPYIYTYIHTYRIYKKECCGLKTSQEIYFSPYTGTPYTVSSGNCPSFSCAISSSLLMLTAGPRGRFPRWRRSRKRLSVCVCVSCDPGCTYSMIVINA